MGPQRQVEQALSVRLERSGLSSLALEALRRERLPLACGLLLVVVIAWAWLVAGAGMLDTGRWTWAQALAMLAMWVVMMAAMMLPSAAPMLLLHAAMAARSGAGGSATGLFALGYLAVWSAFAVVATALQFALAHAALLSSAMRTTNAVLAGAVLVGAGVYQWSPLKRTCLAHCRSPLAFVMTHWREGASGAFAMGAQHGLYCVGCCAVLMLLLFVGGVMNLGWIAGIAAFVLVEKFVPAGHWVSRGAGALLVVWGLAVWFA
jgi:predicted metal-binding membrane protein